jgi:hypothetical protein
MLPLRQGPHVMNEAHASSGQRRMLLLDLLARARRKAAAA